MTLIPWVDAAYAPTLAEAQQAHQQGFRACGFYLPGIPNSDPLNVWTPAQVAVLHQAGLTPVPIAVPDPHLNGDPAVTATAAFQVATSQFGLPTRLSVLYDGPHLVNTGKITGPVWIPAPGPQPSTIGAGSAVQWGQTSISGWSVDTDEGTTDFPFDTGLVCDFEHAILNYRTAAQAVAWYQQFQATIARLAPPTPATGGHRPMMLVRSSTDTPGLSSSTVWVVFDSGLRVPVDTPEDLAVWQAHLAAANGDATIREMSSTQVLGLPTSLSPGPSPTPSGGSLNVSGTLALS